MGVIHFSLDEKLTAFLASQLPLRVFVETGAFHGDSLVIARRFFSDCRSVEMSDELCKEVQARFANDPCVRVQLGSSPAFLASCASELAGIPTFFWLDAHWCKAEGTAGADSQSPLLEELASMGKLHPQSVLLIDDARLYLCPPPSSHKIGDWPDFHAVLRAILSLSDNHRLMVLNDVLVFYPTEIAPALQDFAQKNGVDWVPLVHELRIRREDDLKRHLSRKPGFFKRWRRRLFRRGRPSSESAHA